MRGRNSDRAPGWPKGKPKPIMALRSEFPSTALMDDLKRLRLSPSAAARRAGLDHHAVLGWLARRRAPTRRLLLRFLDVLGLEHGPYAVFLRPAEVRLVCPCGRTRAVRRSVLQAAAQRVKGRGELRRTAKDTFERLCRECASRRSGQGLAERQKRRLRRSLGGAVVDLAEQGNERERHLVREALLARLGTREQLAANRRAFGDFTRRPRTPRHRSSIALAKTAGAALQRPFHLCPLCELAVYALRWHRDCWYTWRRWCGERMSPISAAAMLPPPSRSRGPNPASNLGRNYSWLLARRTGQASLRDLQRATDGISERSTVTKATQAVLTLLPGSWDLVFTTPKKGNASRQYLVRLPDELQPMIERGDRDTLIGKLLWFGMAEDAVARIVGASIHRVRGRAALATETRGYVGLDADRERAYARSIHSCSRP